MALLPYEFRCEAQTCLRADRKICVHDVQPYYHPECFEAEYGAPWSARRSVVEARNRAKFNPDFPASANASGSGQFHLVPPPPPTKVVE